jgi:peptidylprolyl isomerase
VSLLILNQKRDIILSTVNKSDTVKVHYTGKTDDGVVFDSSREREPLQFTMGQGQLIPGFENAVEGMKVGDSTTVKIPMEEAYGDVRPEMMVDIERKQIPPDINPEIGMVLQMQQPDGQPMNVTIKGVTDTHVTLDANHPLAGEALTFDIELVEIL